MPDSVSLVGAKSRKAREAGSCKTQGWKMSKALTRAAPGDQTSLGFNDRGCSPKLILCEAMGLHYSFMHVSY